VEIDQRRLPFHRETEAHIVAVSRVIPSITVTQQAVLAEGIIVRAVFAFDDRHRRDAERDLRENSRFEDTLRVYKRNSVTLISKALLQEATRQHTFLWSQPQLLFEEPERRQPNVGVGVVHVAARLFYAA
jgi:hypothetical protein